MGFFFPSHSSTVFLSVIFLMFSWCWLQTGRSSFDTDWS